MIPSFIAKKAEACRWRGKGLAPAHLARDIWGRLWWVGDQHPTQMPRACPPLLSCPPPWLSHLQLACRSQAAPGGHASPLGIQGQRLGASSCLTPGPAPGSRCQALGRSCKAGPETARVAPRTKEPYPHFTHREAGPDERGVRQAPRGPSF